MRGREREIEARSQSATNRDRSGGNLSHPAFQIDHMPIASRHHDDPTPALSAIEGLTVRQETNAAAMAALQNRALDDIANRFALGHRAYVALMHGTTAAWGWVATRQADIGELGAEVHLTRDERYLWNFVTLAEYRGLGIYPRLLDAIVRAESRYARRFWIVYAPENHASGAGIRKAGFTSLAELSFDRSGRPALQAMLPGGDAVAARILRLTPAATPLSPCWRCVRAGRGAMSCAEGACRCDYQRPASGCAA